MTAPHPRNPQIGRIARLLAVDPSQVHGLDAVPAPQLRELYRMTLEDVRRRVRLIRAAVAQGFVAFSAFRTINILIRLGSRSSEFD